MIFNCNQLDFCICELFYLRYVWRRQRLWSRFRVFRCLCIGRISTLWRFFGGCGGTAVSRFIQRFCVYWGRIFFFWRIIGRFLSWIFRDIFVLCGCGECEDRKFFLFGGTAFLTVRKVISGSFFQLLEDNSLAITVILFFLSPCPNRGFCSISFLGSLFRLPIGI